MSRWRILALLLLGALATPGDVSLARAATPIFSTVLQKRLSRLEAGETVTAWVLLRDKGNLSKTTVPLRVVSERSLARRAKVLPPGQRVGPRDLPVSQEHVDAIRARVSRVRQRSRWFNAVSVEATAEELRQVAALPFVARIDLVVRFRRTTPPRELAAVADAPGAPDKQPTNHIHSLDYGASLAQLTQIGVPPLHDLGYNGHGVLVGHFDNGYRLLSHEAFNSLDIVATHDFVSGDVDPAPEPADPSYFGAHGINTLSTLAGFHEGQLIGPAYGASFVLARTENDASETPLEEDNWVAAMEWADSIGVDVLSSSLAYLDMDFGYPSWTWEDMDGNTTVVTRAADRAVALGIVVVNSAGNGGLPGVGEGNTLLGPADGDSVLAIGSVTDLGVRSSFSSVGPTFDGRIKPDVMARGSSARCASAYGTTDYGSVNGTSFSCPLVAGVVAQLLSARPSATPMLIRDALRLSASQAQAPDNFMGWGIVNAVDALAYLDASSGQENLPLRTRLLANVPNPFNPRTTLSYDLSERAQVVLWIFDVRGQRVRTLVDSVLPPQTHQVIWDGTDDSGRPVGSGIYFARMHAQPAAGQATESIRKMTLVR